MADTKTESSVAPTMGYSQRTKLTLKDLGEPARIKLLSAEELKLAGNKYAMGFLVGRARGVVNRTDEKTGNVYEGLIGTFRMLPNNPDFERLESGVLFIPDAFHNIVSERLKALPDDDNRMVEFVFEVSSIPAKNPAGYSWNFQPMTETTAKDPLDTLMQATAKLTADRQKQLAAPAKSK